MKTNSLKNLTTCAAGVRLLLLVLIAAAALFPAEVRAAKFSRAKVTKVVNEVTLLLEENKSRAASRGNLVTGSMAVMTGQKSRAELQFPDESLVRLGSNSVFSFEEDKRDLEMKRGTILMQVPKSLGRTQVKTAAVTAAITGTTILLEFIPDELDARGRVIRRGSVKIIVVEGSLEFYLNSNPRRVLKLAPGEMVALPNNARRLPKKLNFDIPRLMKTSNLFNMGKLPDLPKIRREVAAQNRLKKDGKLVAVKAGGGGKVQKNAVAGKPSGNNVRQARVTNNARPATVPPRAVVARAPRNPGSGNNPRPPASQPVKPVVLPDRPDRNSPPNTGSTGGGL